VVFESLDFALGSIYPVFYGWYQLVLNVLFFKCCPQIVGELIVKNMVFEGINFRNKGCSTSLTIHSELQQLVDLDWW